MIRLTALNDETSRSSEEGDVHPKEVRRQEFVT